MVFIGLLVSSFFAALAQDAPHAFSRLTTLQGPSSLKTRDPLPVVGTTAVPLCVTRRRAEMLQ